MLNLPKFGALQGVRAVVCGTSLASPHGAQILAENGAQVIHVEHTVVKDVCRAYAGGWLWALEHRNVFEMALDYMDHPQGREIFLKMMETTDILIECNKGGTFEKHNLPDELLWSINPKLVIVHQSGFGQSGDPYYYKRASYDMLGQSFAGYTEFAGPNEGDRDFGKPVVCDYITGTYVALTAMMGLYNAEKTGKGESIDLAQYEAVLRISHYQATLGMTLGDQPDHYTGCDPNIAGEASYECSDGKRVCIFIAGGSVLKRAGKLFGWDSNPAFDGLPLVAKGSELEPIFENHIKSYCISHTQKEVEQACIDNGVPCAPLMHYKDMPEHPHYKARNSYWEYYDANLGMNVKAQAPAGHFKNNPQQVWRGPVGHGFDNEDILKDCGYNDEQIAAFYDCKAISKLDKDFKLEP